MGTRMALDLAVAIGIGLALGAVACVAPWPVVACALGIAILAASGGGRRAGVRVAIALGAALVVGVLRASHAMAVHDAALSDAARVIPRPVRCEGTARVEGSPVRAHGALRWSAALRDATCDGAPWSGAITLFGGPDDLARGDEVAVVCDLAPGTRLWNEGDPRPAEARRGSVRSGGAIAARIVARGTGVRAWIDRARAAARARIDATFADDVSPMARALVLGEADLAPEDDAAMRASGLSHLLAVSGMHLVVAVAGAVAILRALLLRTPLAKGRDVGRLAAIVGAPLAIVYADFAGGSGATWRAAWMMACALAVRALGRKGDAWRAFGISLLAMACGDPLAAFDVSFVLSGAATAGLLVVSPLATALVARAPPLLQPVIRSASATGAASIACAPLIARFAPTLPLGGVVANLLAVPVGESIALPLCLAHALLAPVASAQRGCAVLAAGALRIVRVVARGFASMPALAVHVPPPTSWQLVAIALGLAAFALVPRGRRAPILAAAAACVLLLELGARRAGAPRASLRVTFLDVGQGDAALIDLPDGSAALVDGGGLVGSPIDTGARVVAPMLRSRRRDALAFVALTHPHPDHYGGLATGVADVRVGALWDTGQGEREGVTGAYGALLGAMRARGVPIHRPRDLCGARALGGAVVDVLAPCPEPSVDRPPNDNSLVIRVAYGSRAFLLVGDAEHEEEGDLLRLDPSRLRADVLKVGHHGSRTSSSPAFLAAVGPRVAVVSAGARNRFGHPHAGTLVALAAAGARVLRTDRDGAITVTTDGSSLDVATARVDGEGPSFYTERGPP